MKWRVVELERLHPHLAMALEEVVMEYVSGGGDPVIHLWEWEGKAVTVGNSQSVEGEVFLSRCKNSGIPVIRRISSGGTMFHVPGNEIVYSVCTPPGAIDNDVNRSHIQMLEPISEAFRGLGLDPTIDGNSIMIGKRKISGSAQKRAAKAILHHGTVLYEVNEWEMFSYIKGDKAASSTKGACSNYRPVTSIQDLLDISMDELIKAVFDSLVSDREHYISSWTEKELKRAADLRNSKYSTDNWNLRI
ncbi:MAG: lipoate--protein ligase family protein [Candidatus Thermoplasmatota archaeon]|nr:lipoate--protein ligase family protein [Candidatus Thermoplasmatota archaeon]